MSWLQIQPREQGDGLEVVELAAGAGPGVLWIKVPPGKANSGTVKDARMIVAVMEDWIRRRGKLPTEPEGKER